MGVKQAYYLCDWCGHMFEAPANSIDRTKIAYCSTCTFGAAGAWDDEGVHLRLRGMWG